MTHGYFLDKARAVMTRAGGDPDAATELAVWAEAAQAAGRTTRGVIVAADGRLMADTVLNGYAWYVIGSAEMPSVVNLEMGLACAEIRRATGQPVIHVRYSQVCTGAGGRS